MIENKQFEEWYLWTYLDLDNVSDLQLAVIWSDFIDKRWAFKWGVYLTFFDSVGVYIDIDCDQFMNEPLQFSSFVNHNQVDYYSTRQEAQQAAINKAFSILEKI